MPACLSLAIVMDFIVRVIMTMLMIVIMAGVPGMLPV
jgi:hypothetical protein